MMYAFADPEQTFECYGQLPSLLNRDSKERGREVVADLLNTRQGGIDLRRAVLPNVRLSTSLTPL